MGQAEDTVLSGRNRAASAIMRGIDGEYAFGALLREHRLTAGLTQAMLAERSGLSSRGIQIWSAGSANLGATASPAGGSPVAVA